VWKIFGRVKIGVGGFWESWAGFYVVHISGGLDGCVGGASSMALYWAWLGLGVTGVLYAVIYSLRQLKRTIIFLLL